eukprot:4939167-Pyramimonas_sp.AAC.1
MQELEDHKAELAAIIRDIAAARADLEILHKAKERVLQNDAGFEYFVRNFAAVMGMPSFRSMESDFVRMLPPAAQHASGLLLSRSRFIPGPAVEKPFDLNE